MGIETALIAGAALSVAATAASTISEVNQQKASADAANYNAQLAETNAQVAQRSAGQAEDAQRRNARAVLARQRAAAAETGLGFSGSVADVYGDSAKDAELDALRIRYKGLMDASGLRQEGALQKSQAQAANKAAGVAALNGGLTAASQVAGAYGKYKGL